MRVVLQMLKSLNHHLILQTLFIVLMLSSNSICNILSITYSKLTILQSGCTGTIFTGTAICKVIIVQALLFSVVASVEYWVFHDACIHAESHTVSHDPLVYIEPYTRIFSAGDVFMLPTSEYSREMVNEFLCQTHWIRLEDLNNIQNAHASSTWYWASFRLAPASILPIIARDSFMQEVMLLINNTNPILAETVANTWYSLPILPRVMCTLVPLIVVLRPVLYPIVFYFLQAGTQQQLVRSFIWCMVHYMSLY